MAEIGVTRDADAVVVMVDAVDPQSREMLSDVVVGTVPAAGAYMRISLEGRPEQSNTTNGLHNVAGLNVPAGVVSVTVDPGPGRTCRCRARSRFPQEGCSRSRPIVPRPVGDLRVDSQSPRLRSMDRMVLFRSASFISRPSILLTACCTVA